MNTYCFKYRLNKDCNWQFTMPVYTMQDLERSLWTVVRSVVTIYQLDDMQATQVEVQVAE